VVVLVIDLRSGPRYSSHVTRSDAILKGSGGSPESKDIFQQILRNASEAAAKVVAVTAKAGSGFVELTFRDDGQGMKIEVMRRAFDPFFTTRRQREQFGLGLFKARGDLARMKGQIHAESDGKSYTEMIVRLPVD
jgi:signal transduction histidine kinase